MKYLLSKIPTPFGEQYNISTTTNDVDFLSFPAEVGNPNYDAFLIQVNLTDEQVHELTLNVWYDSPEALTV